VRYDLHLRAALNVVVQMFVRSDTVLHSGQEMTAKTLHDKRPRTTEGSCLSNVMRHMEESVNRKGTNWKSSLLVLII
jgi:hypothetical protein